MGGVEGGAARCLQAGCPDMGSWVPLTMAEEVCGSEIRAGPPWVSLLFVA